MSAAFIRPRHATHADASSSVPGALVSQGLEAEALGDATPLRSARPKLSLRTLGGSFIFWCTLAYQNRVLDALIICDG